MYIKEKKKKESTKYDCVYSIFYFRQHVHESLSLNF